MNEAIQLTDLQIAIMRVLWSKGEATAVQIWDVLRPERLDAEAFVLPSTPIEA